MSQSEKILSYLRQRIIKSFKREHKNDPFSALEKYSESTGTDWRKETAAIVEMR